MVIISASRSAHAHTRHPFSSSAYPPVPPHVSGHVNCGQADTADDGVVVVGFWSEAHWQISHPSSSSRRKQPARSSQSIGSGRHAGCSQAHAAEQRPGSGPAQQAAHPPSSSSSAHSHVSHPDASRCRPPPRHRTWSGHSGSRHDDAAAVTDPTAAASSSNGTHSQIGQFPTRRLLKRIGPTQTRWLQSSGAHVVLGACRKAVSGRHVQTGQPASSVEKTGDVPAGQPRPTSPQRSRAQRRPDRDTDRKYVDIRSSSSDVAPERLAAAFQRTLPTTSASE